MAIPILGDVIREIGGVVRELVPDADKRMDIEVRLAELADRADERENELLLAQTEVNKIEAGSSNLFVAGWRPFIGWTCGLALGYTWILAPCAKALFGLSELPVIAPDQIYPIVLAMLGIGGMRTFEKTRGVATSIGGVVHQPMLPTVSPVAASEKIAPRKKTFNLDWLK